MYIWLLTGCFDETKQRYSGTFVADRFNTKQIAKNLITTFLRTTKLNTKRNIYLFFLWKWLGLKYRRHKMYTPDEPFSHFSFNKQQTFAKKNCPILIG